MELKNRYVDLTSEQIEYIFRELGLNVNHYTTFVSNFDSIDGKNVYLQAGVCNYNSISYTKIRLHLDEVTGVYSYHSMFGIETKLTSYDNAKLTQKLQNIMERFDSLGNDIESLQASLSELEDAISNAEYEDMQLANQILELQGKRERNSQLLQSLYFDHATASDKLEELRATKKNLPESDAPAGPANQ